MKARIDMGAISAAIVFTFLPSSVVAQTPQAILAATAAHDPRLASLLAPRAASSPQTQGEEFTPKAGCLTTFDAPGAAAEPGTGTFPASINLEGIVAGWYGDPSYTPHGFVRYPNGRISVFDAPDAP